MDISYIGIYLMVSVLALTVALAFCRAAAHGVDRPKFTKAVTGRDVIKRSRYGQRWKMVSQVAEDVERTFR